MIDQTYIDSLFEILSHHPKSSAYTAVKKILDEADIESNSIKTLNQAIRDALDQADSKHPLLKRFLPRHKSLETELEPVLALGDEEAQEEPVMFVNLSQVGSLPVAENDQVPKPISRRSSRFTLPSVKSLLHDEEPDTLRSYINSLYKTHEIKTRKASEAVPIKVILEQLNHYDKQYKAWDKSTNISQKKHHLIRLKILKDWARPEGYQDLKKAFEDSIEYIKNNRLETVSLNTELLQTPRPIFPVQIPQTPRSREISCSSTHSSLDDIFNPDLDNNLNEKEHLLNWLGIVYERIVASESLFAMSYTVKLIYISNNLKSLDDKSVFMELLNLFDELFLSEQSTLEINLEFKVKAPLLDSITTCRSAYIKNTEEELQASISALRGHLRTTYKELGLLLLNKNSFCEHYEKDMKTMSAKETLQLNEYLEQISAGDSPSSSTNRKMLHSSRKNSVGESSRSSHSAKTPSDRNSGRLSVKLNLDLTETTTVENNGSSKSASIQ